MKHLAFQTWTNVCRWIGLHKTISALHYDTDSSQVKPTTPLMPRGNQAIIFLRNFSRRLVGLLACTSNDGALKPKNRGGAWLILNIAVKHFPTGDEAGRFKGAGLLNVSAT